VLEHFNAAVDDAVLRADVRACCAAESWMDSIVAGRPYASPEDLMATSDSATTGLDETGLAQALSGHPRIGERAGGEHSAYSVREQSAVATAEDAVRTRLAAANAEYERRFGHVYLVCASGRSADELLAVCRSRLGNDAATERGVVLDELAKINRLRLAKLVGR
jgi:2-oxo-4-hydroxy-4-carboxy-5-ureidoimidazoline decarboxylase